MRKLFDEKRFQHIPEYVEYNESFDDLQAIVDKVNDWWNDLHHSQKLTTKDFETLCSYILYLPIDKESLSPSQLHYLSQVAKGCAFWIKRESDRINKIAHPQFYNTPFNIEGRVFK